jgi:hypothetical protein
MQLGWKRFGLHYHMVIAIIPCKRYIHCMYIPIIANIEWCARRLPSGGWMGVCDAMHLSLQADSLDELHELIESAVQQVFQDLHGDNLLDTYLREQNWRAGTPMEDADSSAHFGVPWHLVAESPYDSMRKAG